MIQSFTFYTKKLLTVSTMFIDAVSGSIAEESGISTGVTG
jgi:hypothetical protein